MMKLAPFRNCYPILLFLLLPFLLSAQGYTSYFTGDTADVAGTTTYGLLLAGGAGDNDEAMQWWLQRAGGGDVVVLRASGSDGYNPYLYDELGVEVNSVETILFESEEAALDPYVIEQIRNAEALFLAGGDQYDYYRYWKDNQVEDAINYLLNEKRVPVGGISAGMAVLGDWYYTPSGSSLTPEEALSDPFHPDYEILGQGDFLQPPFMDNTITDTHYEQRERPGRHVGFLARMAAAMQSQSFGIAANEYTAVAIDENGLARAFGEYPEFEEDVVFFLQSNCQDDFLPEVLEADTPLTWDRGNSAVKVYAIPARTDGSGTFDLTDWQSGSGGEWQNWFVVDGELFRITETDGDCAAVLTSLEAEQANSTGLRVFPNPAGSTLYWQLDDEGADATLTLHDAYGHEVRRWTAATEALSLQGLPSGVYSLEARIGERRWVERVIKE